MLRTLALVLLGTTTFTTLAAEIGYAGLGDLEFGYRQDSFNWSLQGPLGSPNNAAEMDIQDISIVQGLAKFVIGGVRGDPIYLRMEGDWGCVLDQSATYSTFFSDDIGGLVARSIADTTGGHTYDFKVGVGAHFFPADNVFDLAAVVGWSFNGQKYWFRNPDVVQAYSTTVLGALEPLRYWQRNTWNGGFIGLDAVYFWEPYFTFRAEYECHAAHYKSNGYWNYNEQFIEKYVDNANGWGNSLVISATYYCGDCWSIGLSGGIQAWRTWLGQRIVKSEDLVDTVSTLLEDVASLPTQSAPLNAVHWTSCYLNFTFECEF